MESRFEPGEPALGASEPSTGGEAPPLRFALESLRPARRKFLHERDASGYEIAVATFLATALRQIAATDSGSSAHHAVRELAQTLLAEFRDIHQRLGFPSRDMGIWLSQTLTNRIEPRCWAILSRLLDPAFDESTLRARSAALANELLDLQPTESSGTIPPEPEGPAHGDRGTHSFDPIEEIKEL